MNQSDQIFQMVRHYDATRSDKGKDYVIRQLRNSIRHLNKPDQKLTMALFVVLELNRTSMLDYGDLVEKLICLTNLERNEVFEQLPEYMADYVAMAG